MTDALRSHAERRLRFALPPCDHHIQRVVMRLSDINGPRGGADKRCHLQVVLAGLPDAVIEDIEDDLYIAIDRATDRAGRWPPPLSPAAATSCGTQPPSDRF
jgi:ribosome-associated translation inhibitor RaiA